MKFLQTNLIAAGSRSHKVNAQVAEVREVGAASSRDLKAEFMKPVKIE